MYPNFDKVKRTFEDSRQRQRWRAKQNIDFAYLLLYSQNISDYYIQLEDDVLCASNFTSYIKSEIKQNSIIQPHWFMLEFSRLGFIGKLFRSKDLAWVSEILLRLFDSKPGDLMLGTMIQAKGQLKPIHSEYSLFQHSGKFSSLKNKMMPVIDKHFKDADLINLPIMELPSGDNPEARLHTNFVGVKDYPLSAAYDRNFSSFYWARQVRRHDFLLVTLKKPQNISRIIVATGDGKRKEDSLYFSTLHLASFQLNTSVPEPYRCGAFRRLVDFIEGEIDTKAMGLLIPQNILCLKILANRNSKSWVKIRDIVLLQQQEVVK